ncbi:MAG: spore maturation protein [Muribaculaceae bacterium]|nr:spore maturation protein [Bacteroides sp.]MDE6223018.1 spore maturation protein [Muribaculaceae bacterium]MDE6229370.1 spore maturation protein [Muribaculaceae bacterium]MDE6819001.1 spore maturation protein [Muribaculaceae bacterium]
MVLNYIWVGFFLVAFVVAVGRTLLAGDLDVWAEVMSASFSSASTAFELSLGLTGILTLWLGLMKIGERAGVIRIFGRLVSPLFTRLFPGVPKDHPAMGSIFMNVSANMLGLDNAATPLGLKAMQELQELNPEKERATDAMIMFLVLNASGLCLIPISIIMYRAQAGATNPTDVFLPILVATFIATLVGIVALCLKQRISLRDPVLLAWLGGLTAIVGALVWFFSSLAPAEVERYSSFVANFLLFGVIALFMGFGLFRRINLYDAFIDGAREGFQTAVKIIPYLVAILVAIGMFRASGAMDVITRAMESAVGALGFDAQWVGALPTALMKPLSGSGSRGMMVDLMSTYGADSFVARVSAAIQGSTDTLFYVLAVYFGSVGVKRTRYAVGYGLLADVTGSVAGVLAAYLFFG